MLRWRALSGLMTLALLVGLAPLFQAVAAGPPVRPRSSSEPAKYLEIFYSSPVLVRADERVRMPVDVVCATAQGHVCPATVTLGTRVGSEPWRVVTAPATPGLQFDITGPVSRASSSATESVAFFLRAEDSSGRRTTLPPAGPSDPLRFFVARRLPAVKMPVVPMGRVRVGSPRLFLPWGSGPIRAGVELGRQSAAIGPPGFDVDKKGRVYVLDSLQRRLAAFDRGRLLTSHPLSVGPDAVMAIDSGGRAFVADRVGASVSFGKVEASGKQTAASLAAGMASQVRVVGGRAYARVLPLDAWVAHPSSISGSSVPAAAGLLSGLPLPAGDELIRVGAEDRVRVGTLHGGRVEAALELTAPVGIRLGEVALADSDGHGDYWIVVRVARQTPTPADQYEVVHIRGTRVLTVFATASHSFAHAPPLSRFVLGKDGALYQMTSSPEGMRIVRYDLKEER